MRLVLYMWFVAEPGVSIWSRQRRDSLECGYPLAADRSAIRNILRTYSQRDTILLGEFVSFPCLLALRAESRGPSSPTFSILPANGANCTRDLADDEIRR